MPIALEGGILMRDEALQEIRALEAELNYLIRPNMTTAEKIQALEKSFWRSHNAGFCDYIAGMTDNYAVDKYTELFIPAGWQVRG